MKRTEIIVRLREYILKFEKEYMGRGPEDIKVYIIDDLIIFRLKGILTIAETLLAKTQEGQILIEQTRDKLINSLKSIIYKEMENITGIKIKSLYTDINIENNERIIILTLEKNIEEIFDK